MLRTVSASDTAFILCSVRRPVGMSLDPIRIEGRFFRCGEEKWLLKGATYGPFRGANGLPAPEQAEQDVQSVRRLGLNTLRLYGRPPGWFLELCEAQGVRVLVGLSCPAHIDFLQDRRLTRQILREARVTVRALAGSPAVLGYVVANELNGPLVRWLGPARARRFLERMIRVCRREDPQALFTYANYPTTEFLNPRNADFVSYNVYLEQRRDYAAYLRRLHNLADERPLVISEFGMDSQRHGQAAQAETLLWSLEETFKSGAAGHVVFSFTDEWFAGGGEVSDWAFGVVDRRRSPKEAYYRLSSWLPHLHRPGQAVRLPDPPRVSVIICTHNGSRTLRRALESLQRLNYPDYEVLVVDDGSTDAVPEVATEFRDVRYVRIEHQGLSAARNAGAREAGGDILAYMDDDAWADEDWLLYLAAAFAEDDRVGAAGGPNVPPHQAGLVASCVSSAPGGPSHVLMSDTAAEHIPGCNLAVTRGAWEEVGGFDPEFTTAGDDVDFCWRLMEHGYRIAFHPGAVVVHERRRSVRAFLRQQIGYGRAEALLIRKWRHRFGKFGGARWRGALYEPSWPRVQPLSGIIYHGVFGYAPFQSLYSAPSAGALDIITSFHWLLLAGAVGLAGWRWPEASLAAVAMLLMPVLAALWRTARTALPPGVPRLPGKVLLFLLCLSQPVVRGFTRLAFCLRHGAVPAGPWIVRPFMPSPAVRGRKAVSEIALWSEHGRGRDLLLEAVCEELQGAGWKLRPGNEWEPWDFEVCRSRWWSVRCTTVTETHEQGRRLTRVRLSTRATRLTLGLLIFLLCVSLPVAITRGVHGLYLLALSFLAWLALEFHHGAVASQLMRLVLHTSRGLGFRRVDQAPDEAADRSPDDDEDPPSRPSASTDQMTG